MDATRLSTGGGRKEDGKTLSSDITVRHSEPALTGIS